MLKPALSIRRIAAEACGRRIRNEATEGRFGAVRDFRYSRSLELLVLDVVDQLCPLINGVRVLDRRNEEQPNRMQELA